MSDYQQLTVHIPINTALSEIIPLNGLRLVGIQMPAAWDTANLTFQAAVSNEPADANSPTWQNVYDSAGNEVTVTAAAGHYIAILEDAAVLRAPRLRIRSGTNASAVNQTADRTLVLITSAYA